MQAAPSPLHAPYRVSIDEFTTYRRDGFVVIRGLVPDEEIAELRQHTEDLMDGKLPQQREDASPSERLAPPPEHLTREQKANHYFRIHMLHRKLELHERYLLHPRVLDVVQCLVGPDVLALQSMLFLKPPGSAGQGWHQDTYYIPTHPDTLIGAWIAIDDADEYNGGLWMAKGSHIEPVYPPADDSYPAYGDRHLPGIASIRNASNTDDSVNDLAPIADRYPQVLAPARAGDVVFFHSHLLHRSKQNITTDRYRRSFVSHYCNARSFTQWGAGWDPSNPHTAPDFDPATGMSNVSHILARGDTVLPFAKPKFGTPCDALLSDEERRRPFAVSAVGNSRSGDMDMLPARPDVKH
ncbi:MAG TPA: phytanoyl-CoA dioxygenase family protein [Chthoniobacterales bacterium]|jgi:ectoine hydroxylase-related dioxygenase (phytanoyl-CoA dioxygenase family)